MSEIKNARCLLLKVVRLPYGSLLSSKAMVFIRDKVAGP